MKRIELENKVSISLVKTPCTAMSVVKAVDERNGPENHNPLNEVECGDQFAGTLASWNVMSPLEDYFCDSPKGILSFNPNTAIIHFKGFFT